MSKLQLMTALAAASALTPSRQIQVGNDPSSGMGAHNASRVKRCSHSGLQTILNANTVGSLNIALVTEEVIKALTPELWALKLAFTDFKDVTPDAGAESVTAHVPGSFTFGDVTSGWTFTDVSATAVVVPLDKERGHAQAWSDKEMANMLNSPALFKKIFIDPAVEGLANDFQKQIMALWNLTNYADGAQKTVWATKAAATYSATGDLKEALDTRKVPKADRFMMLNPAYHINLLKDADVKALLNAGVTAQLTEGELVKLWGLMLQQSTEIPANSVALVGVAGHPNCQAIASRRIAQPQNTAAIFENAVHPTGLPFQIRQWYDDNTRKTKVGILYNGGCVKAVTGCMQLICTA